MDKKINKPKRPNFAKEMMEAMERSLKKRDMKSGWKNNIFKFSKECHES